MRVVFFDPKGALTPEVCDSIRLCAENAQASEGVQGNLYAALHIVGDEQIREINQQYRGIDRSTDVLSFPTVNYVLGKTAGASQDRILAAFDDDYGGPFLGDIVISTDHALAQAEEYGHGALREYAFLFTHGLLHLFGYDHIADSDRMLMRRREEEILALSGIPERNA